MDNTDHTRFAHSFYTSRAWRKCRRTYLQSVGGLCERCYAKGLIVPAVAVHHKIRLTPENLDDPSISLAFENCEALCESCHQQEHRPTRWRTDELGHVEL